LIGRQQKMGWLGNSGVVPRWPIRIALVGTGNLRAASPDAAGRVCGRRCAHGATMRRNTMVEIWLRIAETTETAFRRRTYLVRRRETTPDDLIRGSREGWSVGPGASVRDLRIDDRFWSPYNPVAIGGLLIYMSEGRRWGTFARLQQGRAASSNERRI
jgi:hypothetical protein